MTDEKYCDVCHRTHSVKEFYASNNLEKYPDGKLNICKKMLTINVDNWKPETYLPILQECDVPYIPKIWNNKLAAYGKDKSKVSGMTIIGRYLSTMKIKPRDRYRWKDTQYLQEVENHAIEEAMTRQGYDIQEIDEILTKNNQTIPEEGKIFELVIDQPEVSYSEPEIDLFGQEDYFALQSGADADSEIAADLTDEDKRYLRLKWGKTYKPEEWVRLEQLYEEMTKSYDIQGAGHEDVLKLVCKTSLKSNQLIDIGDVDGAQKMVKMYDSLMKSGKFTAAQNKAEKGEAVDSISELVELCEKQGYIERFYIEEPNDKVDLTLKDMQRYTTSLVSSDSNLANLIEAALKQNAKEDKESAESQETEIVDDEDIFEEIEKQLSDSDFEEFFGLQEEEDE